MVVGELVGVTPPQLLAASHELNDDVDVTLVQVLVGVWATAGVGRRAAAADIRANRRASRWQGQPRKEWRTSRMRWSSQGRLTPAAHPSTARGRNPGRHPLPWRVSARKT